MTAALSLYKSIGALSFPLTDSGEGTGASLDPARDILLGLLAAALNDELGDRWRSACQSGLCSLSDTTPVMSALPFEPDPEYLTTTEHPLPWLFVYRRDRGTFTSVDTGQDSFGWPFCVDYVIGPLTVGDRRKMIDFLVAGAKVMMVTLRRGGHRAYATQPGHASQPKLVLAAGTDTANLANIRPVELQCGAASFTTKDTKYWALSFTVECEEDVEDVAGDPLDAEYDGVDGSIGTGTIAADDPDELTGVIDPLVELETTTLYP